MEDTLHVLRGCHEARRVWERVVDPNKLRLFYSGSLRDWFLWNFRGKHGKDIEKWSETFAVICWLLWKHRNERIFESKITRPENTVAQASGIIGYMDKATIKLGAVNLNARGQVANDERNDSQYEYDVEVLVDGAFSRVHGSLGCGGVLKNRLGQRVEAFMCRIMEGGSLTAELWACILGMKQAWDKGWRRVVIKTDCAEVIFLATSSDFERHVDGDLISEMQQMLSREWQVKLMQISREVNVEADTLAKKALAISPGYQLVPLDFLDRLLHAEQVT